MSSIEVHHANSLEWLREQPHEAFHAVCTDPPFGIVEFTAKEVDKLRNGNRGGIWRIPPKIGGSERAPLPRFTVLSATQREHVRTFFREFGEVLIPKMVPGGHVFLAGTPMLQYLVQDAMALAGFEVRGAVMRVYHGFRGGDRPKLAEEEFIDTCVTPRGTYEPWMLFRKPISEKTVAQNLRKWGTGALRRIGRDIPLPDIIPSGKTPVAEAAISPHPTLKPQHILRILTRSLLPLGQGVVLEPFAGSGSTLGACKAIGYNAVGVELDETYYNGLEKHVDQFAALYPSFKGESLVMDVRPSERPTSTVRRAKASQPTQGNLLTA